MTKDAVPETPDDEFTVNTVLVVLAVAFVIGLFYLAMR